MIDQLSISLVISIEGFEIFLTCEKKDTLGIRLDAAKFAFSIDQFARFEEVNQIEAAQAWRETIG